MIEYNALINNVLETGILRFNERTGINILSSFGKRIEIDLSKKFPILTNKFISIKNVAIELKFFIDGITNLKWLLERNCNIWLGDAFKVFGYLYEEHLCYPIGTLSIEEFRLGILGINPNEDNNNLYFKDGLDLGPIYGSQWRNFNGVDQLSNLINNLKKNPYDRRHIISAWNPSELDNMVLPPCHVMYQCYVRQDQNKNKVLDLMWYQRSVDLALGK